MDVTIDRTRPPFDVNPTLDSNDPDALGKYVAKLDASHPHWYRYDLSRGYPPLRALAEARLAAAGDLPSRASDPDRALATAAFVATDPVLASLVTAGKPFVRCGRGCEFVAVGDDQDSLQAVYDNHPCPNAPTTLVERQPWYAYLFTWEGVLIASIAMVVLLSIFAPAALD